MKRTKIATLAAAFAAAALAIVSCDPKEKDIAVAAVEITSAPSPLALTVGGSTGKVTARVSPADATDQSIVWTVAPAGVATVAADGTVTAVAAGTATITATSSNGKTTTCAVTVTVPAATVLTYGGTFNVSPGTEYEYKQENARVTLTIAADGKTAELVMFKPKFAERMPEMDITIPGIVVSSPDAGNRAATTYNYTLSGETIVPTTVMGGKVAPVAAYTMKGFSGTVSMQTITFSTKCRTEAPIYDLTFTGTMFTE